MRLPLLPGGEEPSTAGLRTDPVNHGGGCTEREKWHLIMIPDRPQGWKILILVSTLPGISVYAGSGAVRVVELLWSTKVAPGKRRKSTLQQFTMT
jgi:hypothetical protein